MVLAADAADVDTLESERMSRDMDVLLERSASDIAGRAAAAGEFNDQNRRRREPVEMAGRFAVLIARGLLGAVFWLGFGEGASAQTIVEYVHTDALGSPVATTDSMGNLTGRQAYGPYGAPITHAPSDAPGFSGHVEDSATGLGYMQQRYYDPDLALFLSVDPVSAVESPNFLLFNRFAYGLSNPYRYKDPDGRCPLSQMACHPSLRDSVRTIGPIGPISGGGSKEDKSPSQVAGKPTEAPATTPAGRPSNQAQPNGFYAKPPLFSTEVEGVAAYGAGARYTRDLSSGKDSLGIVVVGVGAKGKLGRGLTSVPSLDVIEVGYNWGRLDAPVDIVVAGAAGPGSMSLNFDPGTGINLKYTLSPSVGAYTGVSVMFDDTLVH